MSYFHQPDPVQPDSAPTFSPGLRRLGAVLAMTASLFATGTSTSAASRLMERTDDPELLGVGELPLHRAISGRELIRDIDSITSRRRATFDSDLACFKTLVKDGRGVDKQQMSSLIGDAQFFGLLDACTSAGNRYRQLAQTSDRVRIDDTRLVVETYIEAGENTVRSLDGDVYLYYRLLPIMAGATPDEVRQYNLKVFRTAEPIAPKSVQSSDSEGVAKYRFAFAPSDYAKEAPSALIEILEASAKGKNPIPTSIASALGVLAGKVFEGTIGASNATAMAAYKCLTLEGNLIGTMVVTQVANLGEPIFFLQPDPQYREQGLRSISEFNREAWAEFFKSVNDCGGLIRQGIAAIDQIMQSLVSHAKKEVEKLQCERDLRRAQQREQEAIFSAQSLPEKERRQGGRELEQQACGFGKQSESASGEKNTGDTPKRDSEPASGGKSDGDKPKNDSAKERYGDSPRIGPPG